MGRWMTRMGFPRDWYLIPLAAVIGACAGFAAQGYGQMVRLSEEVFFGQIADRNLSGVHLWLILALPMFGGLLVGLVKLAFHLPMISHGIPEVVEAVNRRGGRLKARTGFFTAVNSALTLGSGGSVGQEGPIVQIGSVVGSVVAQTLHAGKEHMATLVGCGAAGGLAAIFNAPVAGVLLVLEVILRDFSSKTFMPIVIASVFGVAANQGLASALGHSEGQGALFAVAPDLLRYHFTFREIFPYLLLGMACGVGGWGFGRVLRAMELAWAGLKAPRVAKPMLGGLVLGGMGLATVWMFPGVIPGYAPPPFFGNGYPVIETLLRPDSYEGLSATGTLTLGFVLVIVAGKIIGTSLTLGSGGSGGLFAPCLFIGAAAGAAYGMLIQKAGIYTSISPAAYSLAGMAGVLAGAVHCPLTAMILVFEITHDYLVIMPVMLVSITATIVAQLLNRDSVYTMVLREMGMNMGQARDLTLLRKIRVSSVTLTPPVVLLDSDPLQRLIDLANEHTATDFVVCDAGGRYVGMVAGNDLQTALLQREALPLMIVSEIMRVDLPTVDQNETLDLALGKFSTHEVSSLAAIDDQARVLGVISRAALMRAYQESLDQEP